MFVGGGGGGERKGQSGGAVGPGGVRRQADQARGEGWGGGGGGLKGEGERGGHLSIAISVRDRHHSAE